MPKSERERIHAWPVDRADEALEALARRSRLATGPRPDEEDAQRPATGASDTRSVVDDSPRPSPDLRDVGLGSWITDVAERLGLEVEETETPHSEVADMVRSCGPALLRIPPVEGSSPAVLAVLGSRGNTVRVLGTDLQEHRVSVAAVAARLCRSVEVSVSPKVERLLERLDLPPRRVARARTALLEERLRLTRLGGCWLLRLPPGASFWHQLRHNGLQRDLVKFLLTYLVSYGLVLLSWWTLGRGALNGHLSRDWLLAWALILVTLVVPRQMSTWSQARLAVGAGTLLKRRLMQGALKLEADDIRHQGAGQLLGRVIESEAMQTHALTGGFLAAVGALELAVSSWVLAQGIAGWFHVLLLVLWLSVILPVAWGYLRLRGSWTDERLRMTHDLVESMIGHRTRLAQERQDRWHDREDRYLEGYLTSSRQMDARRAFLILSPFVWVLIGICGLLPAFVSGRGSVTLMALAVGGVLLAFRAFNKLARGLSFLASAWISWRQAAPIFQAAARSEAGSSWGRSLSLQARGTTGSAAEPPPPLLEAQDLVYQYQGRARPVLDGCSLQIQPGDRVLIEGPSGGGKSTLSAILTCLRKPSSGLLLLGGLDRHTVTPDVWRRHVVSAPQFHENHVFTETFAFNLLMGRRWPPGQQDMADAREICRELGLGELLERMPGGLMQMVGETGWQLSHGERSRLFMARALLQGSDAVILDESFAALDPENLHRALGCALRRARTLLVIAHP
ncbi:MAG: ATP-binding cassette domain-containing protein [bacterium]|nr:ATP-binding cassette domain-containing protein [bacterium]